MRYSEAKKQIEELSNKYTINMSDYDFNVGYTGYVDNVAYVGSICRYELFVYEEEVFERLPFSDKLYTILSELAMTAPEDRKDIKKYFIHVLKEDTGYLNVIGGKIELDDNYESTGFKTKFTSDEINQLKQRDDVPLDWNKVTLEEARQEEQL